MIGWFRKLAVIVLAAALLAATPVTSVLEFSQIQAEAGIVSKAAKFAAAKLLVKAIKGASTKAAQALLLQIRSDPKLLVHVEEAGAKLIAKNPALREKYAEFLLAARNNAKVDKVVELSRKLYPEATKHADDAVEAGLPRGLEIARKGAASNRKASLKDTPVKKGFDRDEYPPAMMKEGGNGASVRYLTPKDNRGAGACISAQCRDLPDGARILLETID